MLWGGAPDAARGSGVWRRHTHLLHRNQPPPRPPKSHPIGVLEQNGLPDRGVGSILSGVTWSVGHASHECQYYGAGQRDDVRLRATPRLVPPKTRSTGCPPVPTPEGVQKKLPSGTEDATQCEMARLWRPKEDTGDGKLQAIDSHHYRITTYCVESSAPTGAPTRGNTERGTVG